MSAFRAALLVAGCVAACARTAEREIRVQNVSTRDFRDVRIAGESFGDVAAGETSEYRSVRLSFRYAAMEMTVGGRRVTAQTLNVGADRFTHRIDVIDLVENRLDIRVVGD